MNCKEVVKSVHEYLDGELTQEITAQFEKHLQECQPCQKFLQSYRKTIQLLKKTWDKEMPLEPSKKIWRLLERKL